jgi:hypothetical protein
LKQETGKIPEAAWIEKIQNLAEGLSEVLHRAFRQNDGVFGCRPKIGSLPLADSVLPLGFNHLEFGPGALPKEENYAKRERYHAANFLQEVQAADNMCFPAV